MPVYTYRCRNELCQYTFDDIQPAPGQSTARCPACGYEATRQIGERTTFVLKGSGWTPRAH